MSVFNKKIQKKRNLDFIYRCIKKNILNEIHC